MEIKSLSLGPLGTNCYIVSQNKKAIIIDPGADSQRVIDWLSQTETEPIAILLTHAHFDHIGAVDDLRAYYDIKVYLHNSEHEWMGSPDLNGSSLFPVGEVKACEADYDLPLGEMQLASLAFQVRFTPGHSPGGVSFVFPNEKVVFSGDCLFLGGIGRSDLPKGNQEQLLTSIKDELYTLDPSFIVYPGHGPQTTIGHEMKTNPFVTIES